VDLRDRRQPAVDDTQLSFPHPPHRDGRRSAAAAVPPTAPGTPTVTPVAANRAALAWAPSTDNYGVAAYQIERVRPDGRVEPAGVTITETRWTFERLLPDFDYTYRVVAQEHSGNRSAPSPLSFRMPPDPRSSCAAGATTAITIDNTGVPLDVCTRSGSRSRRARPSR